MYQCNWNIQSLRIRFSKLHIAFLADCPVPSFLPPAPLQSPCYFFSPLSLTRKSKLAFFLVRWTDVQQPQVNGSYTCTGDLHENRDSEEITFQYLCTPIFLLLNKWNTSLSPLARLNLSNLTSDITNFKQKGLTLAARWKRILYPEGGVGLLCLLNFLGKPSLACLTASLFACWDGLWLVSCLGLGTASGNGRSFRQSPQASPREGG